MALTWDETDGWIFTDSGHEWLDSNVKYGSYRPGSLQLVEEFGWVIGLATIKEDAVSEEVDTSVSAKWPAPYASRDLDASDRIWGTSTRWML